MRRGMQFVAAVLAVGAVAACSDDSPTVPSSFGAPSLTTGGTQLVCDFPALKNAARAYVAQQDIVPFIDLIEYMQVAEDAASATDLGYDILAAISQLTGDGEQIGTPADGSVFANGVLACMDPAVTRVTTPIDFIGALGPDGAFCVRAGPNDVTSPCFSFDAFAGLAPPSYTGPDPWPAWFAEGRALVYAAPLPSFNSAETVIGAEYEWATVPVNTTLNGKGVVGSCILNPSDDLRVQHREEGSAPTILGLVDPDFLDCSAFASLDRGSPFSHLARSLFEWAAPQPLYASALKLGGGTGGSLGDLSPFAVVDAGMVQFDPTTVVQVSDAVKNQVISPAVLVRIVGAGGTPFSDVAVTVSIELNRGKPAILSGTLTVTTDENGIASFNDLSINKPGGYRLVFQTADLELNPDAVVITSELFHINPH